MHLNLYRRRRRRRRHNYYHHNQVERERARALTCSGYPTRRADLRRMLTQLIMLVIYQHASQININYQHSLIQVCLCKI